MFRDLHDAPEADLTRHGRVYRRWIRPLMRGGHFLAEVAEERDGTPVASGCLWFQPSQPRVLMPRTETPYILSMYTVPAHRRHGLAKQIVRRLVAEARRRGYPRVVLHASVQGRPVYEGLGFEPTTEMRLWIDRRLARRWKAPASRTRRA